MVAYSWVRRAAPDGHTLLMSGLPLFLLPLFYDSETAFDKVIDFSPITRVARAPLAIVVSTEST
jgi:tripartite-type tricarboxylate transporter receptor subunit TctC